MKKIYYIVYVIVAVLAAILMTVCAKQGFTGGNQNYWIEFGGGLLAYLLIMPRGCKEIANCFIELMGYRSEETKN